MSFKQASFMRVLRLGYRNFMRNNLLTLGATLLMTLTLTMISVSVLMSLIIRDTANEIRSKIDLTIYFTNDAVTDSQITALESRVKGLPSVTSTHFIDKSEALEVFGRLPFDEGIKKPLGVNYNPLPRSLLVDTSQPEKIEELATNITGVDKEKIICESCFSLSNNRDVVNKLVAITNFIRQASIVLSIFFGLIAIFNVMNIIKLTIFTRSDEIEIMRYVGASNMFVRGPFVVEGVFYGLIATLFTTIFLLLAGYLVTLRLSDVNLGYYLNVYGYIVKHLPLLIFVQLGIGLVLGILVSIISMRRYLKA